MDTRKKKGKPHIQEIEFTTETSDFSGEFSQIVKELKIPILEKLLQQLDEEEILSTHFMKAIKSQM